MEKLTFTASLEDENKRIDIWLAERLADYTRSYLQKTMENGNITVNGNAVTKNYRIKNGDVIYVTVEPPKELDAMPQDIGLNIVYEDNDLIVVDKPKGLVVHPAVGNPDGTLVNALLFHCKGSLSGIGGTMRPGIVHRIDKNTSGLLVVAKNDKSHLSLSKQIKDHTITRVYRCVVYGNVKNDEGTIDAPIGRHPEDRKKMCITEKNAKRAVTNYKTLQRFRGFSYMELKLETGRTHQIRVHMAAMGHPVAGDPVYGPKKVIKSLEGQCLHAMKLGFIHPSTGKYMEFTSPIPTYFCEFLDSLQAI